MCIHAKGQAPGRITARAFAVMAPIRTDNTEVTLGEALKTGRAVTLRITFGCLLATVLTIDAARKLQFDLLPQQRVQRSLDVTQDQAVGHWLVRIGLCDVHLAQQATCDLSHGAVAPDTGG